MQYWKKKKIIRKISDCPIFEVQIFKQCLRKFEGTDDMKAALPSVFAMVPLKETFK